VSTSVVNGALVGVSLDQQASPSGVWLFPGFDIPWFLTVEKFAALLIIPSSWGSQLDGEITSTPCRIKLIFWRRYRGKRRLLQGEFRMHFLYFVLSFAFTLFLLASFYQKHKKISFLYSCYFITLNSLCCSLSMF
jgi:hypothetical protein